jgi:hypothetical protein
MKATPYCIEPLESRIAPATLIVHNLADSGAGSLRDTILNSHTGDTVKFQASLTGAILLTSGEIDITHKLNLVGPGANKIILNGNNASRIFFIDDGTPAQDSPVSISGLAFVNGKEANGGAIYSSESFTLANCVFTDNTATSGGGAVFQEAPAAGSTATVINCLISGNKVTSASSTGGGMYLSVGKSILISHTSIIANTSGKYFGGLDAAGGVNGGSVTISSSLISGNSSAASGGGFECVGENGAKVAITASVISGNTAGNSGGGGIVYHGKILLAGDTIQANTAAGNGGGIYDANCASLTIMGGTIAGNKAALKGGGMAIAGTAHPVTVMGLHVIGNSVSGNGRGGGINIQENAPTGTQVGALTISGSVFTGNSAYYGGGIDSHTTNTVTISGSEFSSNRTTGGSGGGFFIDGSSKISLQSTKIINNFAAENGGGGLLNVNASGTISASGLIVSGNSALGVGGGLVFGNGTPTVKSSMITGNHAGLHGGGIYFGNETNGTVAGVKITGNTAGTTGGGIYQSAGGGVVLTTPQLVTGNVAPADPDRDGI